MQYIWHGDERSVDYEGELHLSQFDLHKTYFRELNFTRSESGKCLLRPPNLYILHFHFLSWNIFSPSSCVFTAETYRILSYPGKQQLLYLPPNFYSTVIFIVPFHSNLQTQLNFSWLELELTLFSHGKKEGRKNNPHLASSTRNDPT